MHSFSPTRPPSCHAAFTLAAVALLFGFAVSSANAATAAAKELPDPGKLITVAELEPIVGKISKGPRPVDAPEGGVSSEFTFGNDDWVTLTIYPMAKYKIEDAKRILGGPDPVSLPEFGKGAFANPSHANVSAELCAAKGSYVLNISIPRGEGAVEKLKAIAKKALTRL
jgi:hypothetical protein